MNDNPVENYSYDSAGNLDVKNGLDLEYEDANHVHAVTNAGVNTYSYDDNGNQTTRNVGGQTMQLGYDAENRLVSVTGTNLTAQFYYNGDGQRVKSVINTETVYFAGGHYEFNDTTNEVTKHYFAGASRIAVRKYIVPQSTTLNYLLGDHLGSTSVVTNETGALVVETRYKPWGEVRYTTENLTLPTRYTFTGQYSHMDDSATDLGAAGFGLMFYNARWYDPQVGRFAQADTIVPGGLQGLDRYAYVGNNPVKYVDPSGHSYCDSKYADPSECEEPEEPSKPLLTFENEAGAQSISLEEQSILNARAQEVADALADEINKQCPDEAYQLGICFRVTSQQAFYGTFGGPITVKRMSYSCPHKDPCSMEYIHDQRGTFIAIYSNTTTQYILNNPRLIIHEIGHVFYWAADRFISGSSVGDRNGFHGGYESWQYSESNSSTEIFADMFIGWVYGKWEVDITRASGLSGNGEYKKNYMDEYMPLMINKALW